MTSKIRKRLRKASSQHGFTLLEILVVLTIMGFLIAMVAPRLAGISGDAVDTVCDTNQNRMVTYMSSFFEKTNRMPSNLTNLVEETAANTYQIPAVSDQDPDNGPETVAAEFNERNHFAIHYLEDDEAAELKSMGIVGLLNLNAYDAYVEDGTMIKADYDGTAATGPNDADLAVSVTKAPVMEKVTVPTDTTATPFAVAMIGVGVDSAGTWQANTGTERGWGEPDWFGRIVLGMGPECSLITSGIIGNAAHCPGGIQNADNVTYNDYNLVLPRLEATAARIDPAVAPFAAMDGDSAADGVQVAAVAYDDAPAAAAYDYITNDENLRYRQFNISEAQESWQYATQCPEGHMYPEDDGEFWGIDFNPTAAAGGPSAGAIDG